MAEPTLSMGYRDFADHVGKFLGWGPGNWSSATPWFTGTQTQDIDDCVRSGVRKFYYPDQPYDWSFMHPFVTVTLSQGTASVQLPDDVAGVEGQITLQAGTNQLMDPVDFVSAGKIKLLYSQLPGSLGKPTHAAVDYVKGTTALSGQRANLLVFPMADQPYALEFRAYVTPDAPTIANPYVYGGSQHTETIIEACLAVAEQRFDDKMAIHTQLFAERLKASVALDGRNKPQLFGYNGDQSDEKRRRGHWRPWNPAPSLYNGQSLG